MCKLNVDVIQLLCASKKCIAGFRPPEDETLLAFGRSMEVANLSAFLIF